MFSRSAGREIGRIDDLLSRFRTMSRASQQPMETVDVSDPLRDTLETLHAELEDRKIQLRRVGEQTRRPVLGNASQLQQLFLNLCLNAIQAMEPGGELTVRVADLSEGGGSTLLVEVADTGPRHPRRPARHHLRSLRDHQAARHRASASPSAGASPTPITRDPARAQQRRAVRLHVHRRVPRPLGPTRPSRPVKTVLLVSASETLRAKLLRALEDTSVFTAASDEEALRTLRLTEMELIIKEATPPAQEPRRLHRAGPGTCARPGSSCAYCRPRRHDSEDESAAESGRLRPAPPVHHPAPAGRAASQADDKLRLLQEVAALRIARRPAADGRAREPRRRARRRVLRTR